VNPLILVILILTKNHNRSHNIPKQRTACSSASLSHTTPILNELLAAALTLSLSQHPQTAIPTERFAIAHNHPTLKDRTPTFPKQRTACSSASLSHYLFCRTRYGYIATSRNDYMRLFLTGNTQAILLQIFFTKKDGLMHLRWINLFR
jgi:hypothetical protein